MHHETREVRPDRGAWFAEAEPSAQRLITFCRPSPRGQPGTLRGKRAKGTSPRTRARSFATRARMPDGSLLASLARATHDAGWDLEAIGLAWARVSPTVILVPAFGLRALPAPARGTLSLVMALTIFPALVPADNALDASIPWALRLLAEVALGLPPALAAAVPLWAATMTGGLADNLRGAQGETQVPLIEGRTGVFGTLLGLLAASFFLLSGGPSRVLGILVQPPLSSAPLLASVAAKLTSSISLALALGAPLLAASFVLELAFALVARAASPAQLQALLAPLRGLAVLAVFALVFERLAHVVAGHVMAM